MLSDCEIRALYGAKAIVSRKGSFVLVHLDSPTRQQVRDRTREFDPEDYFCSDCPLCQMLMEGGVVVFDEQVDFDETDLLE